MWTLMIADDEPKIRRGLRALVAQLGLPIGAVCEADDGEAALALCRAEAPDLLLVDLNMPFVSGLQFIEQLRQVNTAARIIIITGYEEFEYARRALELGVSAYLLKPVDLEQLKRALAAAIAQLSGERARSERLKRAMQQIARRRDVLCEAFLRELLARELSPEEIDEQTSLCEMPLFSRLALMVIVPGAAADRALSPLMLQFAYQDALKGPLAQCQSAYLFLSDREHVLILYDAEPDMDARLTRAVLEESAGLGLCVHVGIAHPPQLALLADAYDELLSGLAAEVPLSAAVEAARGYIAEHYGKSDLGLCEVAEAAGVNPAYLSRLMKQELGMSFSKYLTTTRINRAVALMQRGNLKIRQVAERVGYSTPHYFSTAFKRVLGASPVDYRSEDKPR